MDHAFSLWKKGPASSRRLAAEAAPKARNRKTRRIRSFFEARNASGEAKKYLTGLHPLLSAKKGSEV